MNMLRLRWSSDSQARRKNGQPAHSTTGVARMSCGQFVLNPGFGIMSKPTTGTDSAAPIHRRRVMSASSGLASGSALTVSGSSAMPQIGQLPGPIWRISGCIGQV